MMAMSSCMHQTFLCVCSNREKEIPVMERSFQRNYFFARWKNSAIYLFYFIYEYVRWKNGRIRRKNGRILQKFLQDGRILQRNLQDGRILQKFLKSKKVIL